ncbi:MAG TPA: RHS repeat-associated core domain-containing protein, partial [Stenotrophobium sp.]|nr:RHS repeat-associated core domain-containing protein [Stenotrophobium sp.]
MYTGREGIGPFLTYNRGRYYDSLLKRFISEDPIGWASGQANNYAYVSGNPVSYTDPTGKYGLPGAAYGAVSGGVGGYVTGGWP